MDIHSICRICLEYLENGNSYDLFLVPGLAKKLCMCTSLSVEPQDGFPKNICGPCYKRLSDMAEFQKLCADSVKKCQDLVSGNWPMEKEPYYLDKARERERLRRLYGNIDRSRSRSHTPPTSKKYSRIDSTKSRRSTSRDKYQRRSPYCSSRRDYRSLKSRSRTRSPQRRERVSHKHSSRSSREHDNTAPTTQFIPIPVSVPAEFSYSLSDWATSQPTWPPSQHRPPMAHYPPYHILPMMPPIRPPHPASYGGLPPNLYGVPYRSQMFIPHRHSLNCYQAHTKTPTK